jgi:ABC-type transport system involved in multi-copper enzyme maturation permease subunit
MHRVWLIGRSVLLEALRRREIYVLVMVASLLIGLVFTLDFFHLEGLTKFHREISLKIMSTSVALMVIVLASRQLPREFAARTIYPLLARPVSRMEFLLGKLLGVMLSAVFGYLLFMGIYTLGRIYMGGDIPWAILVQYIYLQLLQMLVLACLGFALSMLLNLDAAISIGFLLFFFASTLSTSITYLYAYATDTTRMILTALVYVVPQLNLFDLSEKAIHVEIWDPLSFATMLALTVYGLVFASIYFAGAAWLFRRRAL